MSQLRSTVIGPITKMGNRCGVTVARGIWFSRGMEGRASQCSCALSGPICWTALPLKISRVNQSWYWSARMYASTPDVDGVGEVRGIHPFPPRCRHPRGWGSMRGILGWYTLLSASDSCRPKDVNLSHRAHFLGYSVRDPLVT